MAFSLLLIICLFLFCVLQEQLGKPVKLTMGEYTNLKLTTPEDMIIAETILRDRGEKPPRKGLLGLLMRLLGR